MTDRITIRHLDNLCDQLNKLTDSPMASYERNGDGQLKAQIGNHHISQQYGGVCLHRMFNDGGGVTCPLDNYHGPKRELFEKMRAYVSGIEQGRANQ